MRSYRVQTEVPKWQVAATEAYRCIRVFVGFNLMHIGTSIYWKLPETNIIPDDVGSTLETAIKAYVSRRVQGMPGVVEVGVRG